MAKNRFLGPCGVHLETWLYSQKLRPAVHYTHGLYRFDIFISLFGEFRVTLGTCGTLSRSVLVRNFDLLGIGENSV